MLVNDALKTPAELSTNHKLYSRALRVNNLISSLLTQFLLFDEAFLFLRFHIHPHETAKVTGWANINKKNKTIVLGERQKSDVWIQLL
jgi:hypothetical protein